MGFLARVLLSRVLSPLTLASEGRTNTGSAGFKQFGRHVFGQLTPFMASAMREPISDPILLVVLYIPHKTMNGLTLLALLCCICKTYHLLIRRLGTNCAPETRLFPRGLRRPIWRRLMNRRRNLFRYTDYSCRIRSAQPCAPECA